MVSVPHFIFFNLHWLKIFITLKHYEWLWSCKHTLEFKNYPFYSVSSITYCPTLSNAKPRACHITRCCCLLLDLSAAKTKLYLLCTIPLQTTDFMFVLQSSDLNCPFCPFCFLSPSAGNSMSLQPLGIHPLFRSGASAILTIQTGAWEVGQMETNFPLPSLSDVTTHNSFHASALKVGKWIWTLHPAQIGVEGEGRNSSNSPCIKGKAEYCVCQYWG